MSSSALPADPVGDSTDTKASDLEPPAPLRGDSLWYALAHDQAAIISLAIIAIFVITAITAPLITGINGQNPYSFNPSALADSGLPNGPFGGISAEHWFGVEPLAGRDIFAIVVYGARASLLFGLAATLVSLVLGIVLGLVAGYRGGWWDKIISRATDVVIAFPSLIFLITLGAVSPDWLPKSVLLVIVVGLFGWPTIARVVRAQVLSLRSRNFIHAAQAMGAGQWHIMFTGLLPNLWATIIVFATLSIPAKIGTEAALSFLGVGLAPPTPSWGRTIGTAINWIQTDPWFLLFPALALFVITLAFNVLGDSLRDAQNRKN